jgi:nucleolar protein 12
LKRKGINATESADRILKKRRKSSDADELTHKHIASVRAESKKRDRPGAAVPDADSAEGHSKHDIEEEYFARSHKTMAEDDIDEHSLHTRHGESSSDDEKNPQHESLTAKMSRKKDRGPKDKTKYVPLGETREQRDERTIFIGNLPTEIAKTKVCSIMRDSFAFYSDIPNTQPALRALQRLITSAVPGCKIESTRFRSVAFQNPTSELPKLDDESGPRKPINSSKLSGPASDNLDELTGRQSRQFGRAAWWREQEDIELEKSANAKTFITPAEKKRIAFIKGELHSEGATLHAYIVFAHEEPGRSKNVPPVMNPFEAAKRAVEVCDGMVYMDRTIRVDHVRAGDAAGDTRPPGHFDPRRTVFVGGLDFQTKEEDLRALFEKLLIAERGDDGDEESSDSNSDNGENEDKLHKAAHPSWVTHVRIIRDKDTQLGKGIAYVEFKVRTSPFLQHPVLDPAACSRNGVPWMKSWPPIRPNSN